MIRKEGTKNFSVYLSERKKTLNEEMRVLNETSRFFRENFHTNFILLDVANFFNVDLKTARRFVTTWKRFGIVELTAASRLPKSYKILKVPDDS